MSKERYDNIIIISIIFFLFLTFTHQYVSADDADVMSLLARSLIPTPSTWTGSNFCKWEGVSCYSNKVTSINLSSKSLSGTIPPQIIQLSDLKLLSLQRNQFSGSLPPLSNHPSLEEINLDFNNFNSMPKDFLSGLTSLQSFSINNNTNLEPWNIPQTLKDSTTITSFLASSANIIGQIPDIFDSLQHLQSIKLSYNNMTGSLPKSFAKSSIQYVWLNNVGFSGTLDVLGEMTQLEKAYLQMNKFSGPIPDLSACTELTDLQLRDNILTGVIPDSLTKLPKLENVVLQDNYFQGPMPVFPSSVQVSLGNTNIFCNPNPGPCDPQVTTLLEVVGAMGYPVTLTDSWIGNNPCQNWKFVVCDKGSVTKLSFGKQNWTGTISPAIANLPELKSLLLNDNKLDGVIPVSLTSLKHLEIIDISNNNISGKVPIFASSVKVITTGNVFIGQDLSGSLSHNDSRVSMGTIVISVIVVLIISVLGFLIYRSYARKRSTKYQWAGECSAGNSGKNLIINVDKTNNDVETAFSSNNGEGTPSEKSENYHVHDGGNVTIPVEVLHAATNNFSEGNIIGRGGFGVVYKGKLHDGTKIAVKRMESSVINNKGLLEFKAEIEVLTKVKHRSLVALHGFCDNGNERLLVYEYMPQGCLEDHLFDWKVKGVDPLTWNKRVTIALDVARGVEYLHSLAQQSFIHRDLKPSNILLGEDMRAKVSDFGLVKSAPDGNYSFETRLAGTFGYLAPEYAATGRVTTKVDVFAFGVILMEIITGRRALDDKLPNEQCHLVTYFRRLLVQKDSIQGVVDSTLRPSMDEKTFQSILKVAELAGHCTAREPHQRPDMSHAVNVLSCLGEQWTPVPDEEESFGVDRHLSLPQAVQKWKANEDSFFENE